MLMRTICPHCDAGLEAEPEHAHRVVTCGSCGREFVADPAVRLRRVRPPRDDREDDRDDRPRRRYRRRPPDGSGWAVGSLVLGIISAVIFCLWPLGLVVAAAGLVSGVQGLRSPARRLAIVGLVFSSVGLTFAAGIGVTMIVAIAAGDPEDTPPRHGAKH